MSSSILFVRGDLYLIIWLFYYGTTVADVFLWIQAYDQHLNMILGDVEEVVTTVEIDDETYEEIVRVSPLAFLP